VIESILPPEVAAVDTFADLAGAALFPEEEDVIARAVAKRRSEFATARACAREALARLGFPPSPIPRGPGGAPRWPPGAVGSITHCAGYRACAAALARDMASVGIDAEPDGPLPEGVLGAVTDHAERSHVTALLAERPGTRWDRLLFSAKESVYKTWFPLTGRWLGFGQAAITIDPEAGTFTAVLRVPGPVVSGHPVTCLPGRWQVRDGIIVTAIALSARPAG
jgi:4'-phosphopantetheinyl transferase EntD